MQIKGGNKDDGTSKVEGGLVMLLITNGARLSHSRQGQFQFFRSDSVGPFIPAWLAQARWMKRRAVEAGGLPQRMASRPQCSFGTTELLGRTNELLRPETSSTISNLYSGVAKDIWRNGPKPFLNWGFFS